MYNLAIFTSSFPYPSVEISAMVTGIIVVVIVAYRGRDDGLSGKVG